MIKINDTISPNGFSTQFLSDGWKIAFVTYAEQYDEMKVVKRHNLNDEVFVLVKGSATLYASDQDIPTEFSKVELQEKKAYKVEKGTWHHLKVSKDALLVVVENSNTSKENTDAFSLNK